MSLRKGQEPKPMRLYSGVSPIVFSEALVLGRVVAYVQSRGTGIFGFDFWDVWLTKTFGFHTGFYLCGSKTC